MGKKQKIKKPKSFRLLRDKKNRTLVSILISFNLTIGVLYAADIISESIANQKASGTSSNNAEIYFSTGADATKHTKYINAGNNSTIIGNYLKGYYYDSVFGYFRLDWSTDKKKNVRIISSTSKCSNGYGYKLGGKAHSINAGYIDFNYDASTFVYYCLSDKKLHGKGYSRWVGYQDFEGIGFEIFSSGSTVTEKATIDIFTNDTTAIDDIKIFTGSNSNVDIDKILGEQFKFDTTQESIFYIIK